MVHVMERIQSDLDLWIGTMMKTSTRVDGAVRVDIVILVLEASLFLLLETMVPPILPSMFPSAFVLGSSRRDPISLITLSLTTLFLITPLFPNPFLSVLSLSVPLTFFLSPCGSRCLDDLNLVDHITMFLVEPNGRMNYRPMCWGVQRSIVVNRCRRGRIEVRRH